MTSETPEQRRHREYREQRLYLCRRVVTYIEEGGVITDEVDEAITALAAACSAVEDDILLDEGRAPGDSMPGDDEDD